MVQAKVADFGFAGNGAVVDALLANELAAAESDVEDGIEASPGAEEGFGKAGTLASFAGCFSPALPTPKPKGSQSAR